jgi:GntR family transcriptional regulator
MSKWQQVADDLRTAIRSGRYKPGEKLPSYAELQRQYDTSYGTVLAAMRMLHAEGLITGEQGVGTFVRGVN